MRRNRGEIRKSELIALAHDDGPIDRVLELTDVAGPIELRQIRHRLAGDAGNRPVFLGAEPREEMAKQMGNILAPRAQRRDRQRQHVQTIEQVFPEMAAFDAIQQFAIGRRNDANVDLDWFAAADRLDGALLQRAQKLDLRGQRQFRNFIEKQRTAMRLDEFASVSLGRTGERALLMAEQVRFYETVGARPAIYRT